MEKENSQASKTAALYINNRDTDGYFDVANDLSCEAMKIEVDADPDSGKVLTLTFKDKSELDITKRELLVTDGITKWAIVEWQIAANMDILKIDHLPVPLN